MCRIVILDFQINNPTVKTHNPDFNNAKIFMVTRQENKRRKGGPQRIRLTFESVNGNWHGEALISREILSVHLGGSLPGVVPPSKPWHSQDCRHNDWCGSTTVTSARRNKRRWWERVETSCGTPATGPIGLPIMGFPSNGSPWQVVSSFSSSSALAIKTSPWFTASL